ncbi:pseudouridine synthase [Pseudomonas matsuisoli]|uniref:Pseudouridine synthase RsuA/RluA-like domain-containing protein n=1 Tax=Pseudomonas matsuisoli TaxID=1515666 RepID=A0A917PUE5_9PSED|nr:hypothetical protein GCM10009304_16670 [Pseudomonas matsuisoli]
MPANSHFAGVHLPAPDASTALHGASTVCLPSGPWQTVLDCLADRFPAIPRNVWADRMRRGRVLDADGRALAVDHAYQAGLRVRYFREVAEETPIPFEASVIYQDDQLIVADKPHFLPVVPSGPYVEETLVARLIKQFDNPHLVPLHRIDRLTAGLVMFSVRPESRNAYLSLFRERRIYKGYEAIAPALAPLSFPLTHRSRLVTGDPFILTAEAEGAPNSETHIDVLERRREEWRYALKPVTGRKHQLRVHMSALGAPIKGDPFYPTLAPQGAPDDYAQPLRLLARTLRFVDPVTGEDRLFESRRTLDW